MDVDIDTGALQAFAASKINAPLGGSLMRYHSAPSSVLAGLLDDDFFPTSDDSEFARLLSDGIGSFSSLLDPCKGVHQHITSHPDFSAIAKAEDLFLSHGSSDKQHSQYLGGGSTFQEHLSQNPLSAISEYGLEETVKDVCMPLPSEVVQQVPREPGHVDGTSYKSSCVADMQAIPFKSGPIPQSSSPADALSRLVKEENSDKVKLGCGLAGSHLPVAGEKLGGQSVLPTSQVTVVNTYADVTCKKGVSGISSPRRPTALLRQSSSPAGLLSQINDEDFIVFKENRPIKFSSGLFSADIMIDRKGLISGQGHGLGSGDDNIAERAMQHFVDLGQRKRGRGFDDKLLKGLQRCPVDLATVTMSNVSPPSSSCPGSVDCLEGLAEESVLCKARAKRGCATHPRSIAERQRRIKISERMKKLQDLVPNLDRQASTAEMLDEVVEYVKLLQRHVQELSLNRPKCTGSCQQGGSPPH